MKKILVVALLLAGNKVTFANDELCNTMKNFAHLQFPSPEEIMKAVAAQLERIEQRTAPENRAAVQDENNAFMEKMMQEITEKITPEAIVSRHDLISRIAMLESQVAFLLKQVYTLQNSAPISQNAPAELSLPK